MVADPDPELPDQKRWEDLTRWKGSAPRLGEAWELLSSGKLPATFQDALNASKHRFLRRLRDGSESLPGLGSKQALEPQKNWNNRFANLVSGRFTEVLFLRAYQTSLEKLGLTVMPRFEKRDWHDWLIEGDQGRFQIAVNVKNAGIPFRQAAQFTGLKSDDTLPIATYKIFGSSAKENQMPVLYVFLVDWTLLPRLRTAYWTSINEVERKVFQIMTSFKGMPRDIEDRFIEATVADHIDLLCRQVDYDLSALDHLPFTAISGARCKAVFYTNHARTPYVFLTRMNTDPAVHVSVADETLSFPQFIRRWLISAERRADLQAGLRRKSVMSIPDPPV